MSFAKLETDLTYLVIRHKKNPLCFHIVYFEHAVARLFESFGTLTALNSGASAQRFPTKSSTP